MNFDEISLMIFYCTKGSKWIEVDGFPLVYLHPLIICLSGAQEVLIIIKILIQFFDISTKIIRNITALEPLLDCQLLMSREGIV